MVTHSFDPNQSSEAAAPRSLDRCRSSLSRAACVLALVAVSACTQMPIKEGPRARLFEGIEKPRDRNNMDVTIHKLPVTAWPKCLEMIARKNPVLAVASAVTLSVVHACARVPRDKSLKAGQRPWCIVAVPEGDETALEHELRHCEGWDHPRSASFEQYAREAEGETQ